MQSVTTLPQQISCIDTGYQRAGLAACYLIESAGEAAFVDTGTVHTVPRLMQLLESKGLDPTQVKYVIPTHVHLDHAGGAGELMQRLPQAQRVVHPFGARHLIDPAKLNAGATAVYGEDLFQQLFGKLVPIANERVVEAEDGFTLSLGGRELLCLDTPGHARHHICVYDAQSGGIFTGDTFGLSYPELDTPQGRFILPTTTPVQFDPEAWHHSLDRMMSFQPGAIYLTHYGRLDNPRKLASDLHRGIDEFANIALNAQQTHRSEQIRKGLLQWTLQALGSQGGSHTATQVEAILGLDLDLNAQGLEVWLQRREKD